MQIYSYGTTGSNPEIPSDQLQEREREDHTFLILTCSAPTSLLTWHTSHIQFCHFPGQPMLRHGYMLLLVLLSDLEYPFLSVFWPISNFLLIVTLLQPSGLLLSVWFSPHLYLLCIAWFLIITLYFVSFLWIYFPTRVQSPVIDFAYILPASETISGTIATVNTC